MSELRALQKSNVPTVHCALSLVLCSRGKNWLGWSIRRKTRSHLFVLMFQFIRDSIEIFSVYNDHGTPCICICRCGDLWMLALWASRTAQINGSYGILLTRTITQRILHSSTNNIPSKQLRNSVLRHNKEFGFIFSSWWNMNVMNIQFLPNFFATV